MDPMIPGGTPLKIESVAGMMISSASSTGSGVSSRSSSQQSSSSFPSMSASFSETTDSQGVSTNAKKKQTLPSQLNEFLSNEAYTKALSLQLQHSVTGLPSSLSTSDTQNFALQSKPEITNTATSNSNDLNNTNEQGISDIDLLSTIIKKIDKLLRSKGSVLGTLGNVSSSLNRQNQNLSSQRNEDGLMSGSANLLQNQTLTVTMPLLKNENTVSQNNQPTPNSQLDMMRLQREKAVLQPLNIQPSSGSPFELAAILPSTAEDIKDPFRGAITSSQRAFLNRGLIDTRSHSKTPDVSLPVQSDVASSFESSHPMTKFERFSTKNFNTPVLADNDNPSLPGPLKELTTLDITPPLSALLVEGTQLSTRSIHLGGTVELGPPKDTFMRFRNNFTQTIGPNSPPIFPTIDSLPLAIKEWSSSNAVKINEARVSSNDVARGSGTRGQSTAVQNDAFFENSVSVQNSISTGASGSSSLNMRDRTFSYAQGDNANLGSTQFATGKFSVTEHTSENIGTHSTSWRSGFSDGRQDASNWRSTVPYRFSEGSVMSDIRSSDWRTKLANSSATETNASSNRGRTGSSELSNKISTQGGARSSTQSGGLADWRTELSSNSKSISDTVRSNTRIFTNGSLIASEKGTESSDWRSSSSSASGSNALLSTGNIMTPDWLSKLVNVNVNDRVLSSTFVAGTSAHVENHKSLSTLKSFYPLVQGTKQAASTVREKSSVVQSAPLFAEETVDQIVPGNTRQTSIQLAPDQSAILAGPSSPNQVQFTQTKVGDPSGGNRISSTVSFQNQNGQGMGGPIARSINVRETTSSESSSVINFKSMSSSTKSTVSRNQFGIAPLRRTIQIGGLLDIDPVMTLPEDGALLQSNVFPRVN